jgi:thiamine kinase-like enzyme
MCLDESQPTWLSLVFKTLQIGTDSHQSEGVFVNRIYGGANNAIYRISTGSETWACKIFVQDDRRRAFREFSALTFLENQNSGLATDPIYFDESCEDYPYPIVVYKWIHGKIISPPISTFQLEKLLASYHQLHRYRFAKYPNTSIPTAWFHWFNFETYIKEIRQLFDRYGPWLAKLDQVGENCFHRMNRVIRNCNQVITTTKVNPHHDFVPPTICRVDPNLSNIVWNSCDQLRWIDWEYSGWGDPALDLSELRWHAALNPISPDQHSWLRSNYQIPRGDHGFIDRLLVWDSILVTRWPLLVLRWLWTLFNGPDRERLTTHEDDPGKVRDKMTHLIDRAEHFFENKRRG